MRFIHTSDWHLGRTLFGYSLHDHHEVFLDWLLEQAVTSGARAIVVAGDVYDRSVPPTESVALLEKFLTNASAQGVKVIVTSGNHDSAIRLGSHGALIELAGIHLRTKTADIARPVILSDEHGQVAFYGIPYLRPEIIWHEVHADERTHQAVLQAATDLIREDLASRPPTRSVVLAHAFITGGSASDSERAIDVGGVSDAPSAVFDGFDYVALGHLHGNQTIALEGSSTELRYSGTPLAFSFSELNHTKAINIVDIDSTGATTVEVRPIPVQRPIREVRGELEALLAMPATDERAAGLEDAWVRVILTDAKVQLAPMERLQQRWPYVLTIEYDASRPRVEASDDLERLRTADDPLEVCRLFVEYVDNEVSDAEIALLTEAIETVQRQETSA